MNILHYLGGLTLFVLGLQIATGLLLMAYYRPSVEGAHESVCIITDEVRLGWLVRYLHRWGTDFLIILSALHLFRVYLSRAYQGARQLNWTVGVLLLILFVASAFTGTLLPWDQYGYWHIDSARQTISGIPVLGNVLLGLFWGGWEIGEEVLLRFYGLHVGTLPCIALVLLFPHILMVWRFGIKAPVGIRRSPPAVAPRFFPDLVLNLLIAVLLMGGLLLSVAVIFPPLLAVRADPVSPLAGAQPWWYLLPLHELLRNLPGELAALAVFALILLLFLVPVLDGKPTQSGWGRLLQRSIGVLVIVGWVVLGVRGYLR